MSFSVGSPKEMRTFSDVAFDLVSAARGEFRQLSLVPHWRPAGIIMIHVLPDLFIWVQVG